MNNQIVAQAITKDLRMKVWKEMHEDGVHPKEVAKKYGIGYSTAQRWRGKSEREIRNLNASRTTPDKAMPRFRKKNTKANTANGSGSLAGLSERLAELGVHTTVSSNAPTGSTEHTEKLFLQAAINVLDVDAVLCVMLEYQKLRS